MFSGLDLTTEDFKKFEQLLADNQPLNNGFQKISLTMGLE